ncbi:hypothetical protein M422DRAFT_48156 [Sphaerobolus stellatus SS14]|uniref:Uncharacterized protein n=1 Tax=Sphaerobolus stellatus (strain SS14) TaxID=990650 RepID=A0A0C9VLA4_SPHS4|nr:hypothetical protein M422DRAFT_48156 [Sphaerobolus stellatus SS14]
MRTHTLFDLEHIEEWVKGAPYLAFMALAYSPRIKMEEDITVLDESNTLSSPLARFQGTGDSDSPFVYKSDSEEPEDHQSTPMTGRKHKKSGSSSSWSSLQPDLATPPSQNSAKRPRTKSEVLEGPFQLTSKASVPRLIRVTEPQKIWNIPRDSSGYLLDLTGKEHLLLDAKGNKLTVDALVRAEDYESWCGSSGNRAGNTIIDNIFEGGSTNVRRVTLHCRGTKGCELLDRKLLQKTHYEHKDADLEDLVQHNLKQRQEESSSASNAVARFYRMVMERKCLVEGCNGHPVMKPRSKGPSLEGKDYFVGCSNWSSVNEFAHLYQPIPRNVDENVLWSVFQSGWLPSEATFGKTCTNFVHARVPNQEHCHFSHIHDGQVLQPRIVSYDCPTMLIMYVPVNNGDIKIPKAILIFRNPHNHLAPTLEKLTPTQEKTLRKVIIAAGLVPLPAQKIVKAPTTKLVLEGQDFHDAVPAANKARKCCDKVCEFHNEHYIWGMGWEGVEALCKKEAKLLLQERYVNSVIIKPDFRLAVTMHPQLVKYIHDVDFIVVHFTFKPVRGNIDRWDVAGFLECIGRRILFVSIYSTRKTRAMYYVLWREFFDTVKVVTGKELRMPVFHGEGRLKAIIPDGEVAQGQGLGDWLLTINNPEISKITMRDPLFIILYILKLCRIHYLRDIDDIDITVPKAEIDRLKQFPSLKDTESISEWHALCAKTPYKGVADWYVQKCANPWVLKAINPMLSLIPREFWDTTPDDSNLVETAHVGHNKETGINNTLLGMILASRDADRQVMAAGARELKTGNLKDGNNTLYEREHRAIARKANSNKAAQRHEGNLERYRQLEACKEVLEEHRAVSLARDKQIEATLQYYRSLPQDVRHAEDVQNLMKQLREEKEQGLNTRREILVEKKEVDSEMKSLRTSELKNKRLNGIRSRD